MPTDTLPGLGLSVLQFIFRLIGHPAMFSRVASGLDPRAATSWSLPETLSPLVPFTAQRICERLPEALRGRCPALRGAGEDLQ